MNPTRSPCRFNSPLYASSMLFSSPPIPCSATTTGDGFAARIDLRNQNAVRLQRVVHCRPVCLPKIAVLSGEGIPARVKGVQDFVGFRELFGEFVIGRAGLAAIRALVKRERVFGAGHRGAVPVRGPWPAGSRSFCADAASGSMCTGIVLTSPARAAGAG